MTEPSAESFAVLLRRLRTEARMTQEDLAGRSRLSVRSISDLERGVNRTARRDTARLLADALNLTGATRAAFEMVAAGRSLPAGTGAPAGSVAAASRTLPRDVALFTGRETELSRIVHDLKDRVDVSGVVGLCVIGGMAGVGKTALAVHAAHLLAPRYPDGQIYLPLHGHTQGRPPVDPAEALASLLQTSGMQQVPDGLEARARLWRDRLAGLRILLLYDDATGHEQIRPLLPGTTGSLVLVTSRLHMTALEDAEVVGLDTLPPDEAVELFARLAAPSRLDADGDAVQDLARMCGYLPLAIGMLARHLRHHPSWTPRYLASRLAAAQDRLSLMHAENLSVAAAFDLSYEHLTAPQRQLFRRLGLFLGTDFDAWGVAALDDVPVDTGRLQLEALYNHHLLTEPSPGRYAFHELIAQHARALSTGDPLADTDAAWDRLLGYYLYAASTARQYLPRRSTAAAPPVSLPAPARSPPITASEAALAWMQAERVNLQAIAQQAPHHGRPEATAAIAAAMDGYLWTHGHWDQALRLHQMAVIAARATGEPDLLAAALTDLGHIQRLRADYPAAEANLTQALTLRRNVGSKQEEANVLNHLGAVQRQTGALADAAVTLDASLQVFRDLGDQHGEARVLNNLGTTQRQAGALADAAVTLDASLQVFRDLGDQHGEARVLNNLGAVQREIGDNAAAAASLAGALRLLHRLGDRPGEAEALNNMGDLALADSAPASAHDYYLRARTTAAQAAPAETARAEQGLHACRARLRSAHDLGTVQGLADEERP